MRVINMFKKEEEKNKLLIFLICMTCFCSAVWKPNEDYYHLASAVTYTIEREFFSEPTTIHLLWGIFEDNRQQSTYEPVLGATHSIESKNFFI